MSAVTAGLDTEPEMVPQASEPPQAPAPSPFEYHSPLLDAETGAAAASSDPSVPAIDASPRPAAPPAALPAGSGVLDSATIQRIVERLVSLHFLTSAADAGNADVVAQAIKDFQSSAGISPTGTLDRDTIGRLTTP